MRESSKHAAGRAPHLVHCRPVVLQGGPSDSSGLLVIEINERQDQIC